MSTITDEVVDTNKKAKKKGKEKAAPKRRGKNLLDLPSDVVRVTDRKPRYALRWTGVLIVLGAAGAGGYFAHRYTQRMANADVLVTASDSINGTAGTIMVTKGRITLENLDIELENLGAPDAIQQIDESTWQLNRSVQIDQSGRLEVGDVTLRMQSDSAQASVITVLNGDIKFNGTTVTSWTKANAADDETGDGRAHIRATGSGKIFATNSTFVKLGADAKNGGALVGIGNGTELNIKSSTFIDNVQGVLADDATLDISDSTIYNSSDDGIEIRGVTEGRATVEKVRILGSKGAGLSTERSGTVVSLSDFSANIEGGIKINPGGNNAVVSGVRTFDNLERGIRVSADGAVIDDSLIWNNPIGIDVAATTGATEIRNNKISSNTDRGIVVGGTTTTLVTILGNRIDHNVNAGILVKSGPTKILQGNEISENEVGIRISDPLQNVEIRDNAINTNFRDGISIDGAPGLTITGNDISNNDSAAFSVLKEGDATIFVGSNQIGPHRNGTERVRT